MFSTFDSLVFVFARFHGISKCPKTLQCLPPSLPPLYGVFSGSNGCTWHLTWLAFVDDETQLFQVGKNISPWRYLPRIEEAGQGRPSDLIRLECPLTRIFARGSNETLNSASVNGLLTQLNGSLAHNMHQEQMLRIFSLFENDFSALCSWPVVTC